MNKKERHIILDPFSCLAKLALLKYMPIGTKISIYENKLYFNEPSSMQGVVRFIYGDGREDLHNLYQPIRKCAKWFWNDTNGEIKYLFQNAVGGIKMLKGSYSSWSTIQHTLDYYILILIQNDMRYFSSYISTGGCSGEGATAAMKATIERDMAAAGGDSDTEGEEIPSSRNFNPISSIVRESTRKRGGIPAAPVKAQSTPSSSDASGTDQSSNITTITQMSDIHKYLKALWSEREMMIIINLFHELDTKTENGEKKYIHDNIMQYCSMKENRLNKYIDDNSHFL
jgi:hypothetical protein